MRAAAAAPRGAKPRICFVAPAIYPVLSGDRRIESVGGAEVQQTILARTLQQAGYQVSVVTMDYGQPAVVDLDGIQVYRAHSPHGGLPVLRYLHPRITSIWRAMQLADADIYYQRASGMLAGLIAHFCARYRRKFVFAAASDADFFPDLPLIHYSRDKWLYRRGLRRADAVVVQNPVQQQACRERFGRAATIVPSCHAPQPAPRAGLAGYVLWAGTIKALKRPELFLELARRLPQYRFVAVGGGDAALLQRLREQSAGLANLEWVGFVPYSAVDPYFDGARLLLNTSVIEGFPNTFLQAWARGVPSISFFDNGSRHQDQPVTRTVADLDAMAAAVAQWMGDDLSWQGASARVRDYFEASHTPAVALRAYQQVFAALDGE